jgi:MFS family permease
MACPRAGIATALTIVGCFVGYAIGMQRAYNPELGSYMGRIMRTQTMAANYSVAFAVGGALVGILIDVRLNGWLRRREWRYSMRTLLMAMVAFSVLAYGLRCFFEIQRLTP